jgi:hypothetical protein
MWNEHFINSQSFGEAIFRVLGTAGPIRFVENLGDESFVV